LLRFSALKREIGEISQGMLAQTARRLEEDGYLSRTVHPTILPRVDYAWTPLRRSLLQCIEPLVQWASSHLGQVRRAWRTYAPPPRHAALGSLSRLTPPVPSASF
jgi:DNA-binding HxlR family transcriptional regulator